MQNFRLREKPTKKAFKINPIVAARVIAKTKQGEPERPFNFAKPAPGVLPANVKPIAMDDGIAPEAYGWAQQMQSRFNEGIGFLGYPYLSELSQRPEYRRISETLAKEMTRKWIKLQAIGDGQYTERLAAIESEMKRLKVQEKFREALELDGFFGRAHIYLDTGDGDNPEELKTTIGNGSSKLTKAKVNLRRPLRRLVVIEPVWTYPNSYNASDPLRDDYFNPTTWFVQGRLIHSTRLLTLVGRQVPDLLKPAYSFGGLSLSQMAKPYIDNWLRTRQSVSDLIHNFSTSILKTNLEGVLSGGTGEEMLTRAELFNAYRDNQGLMMLDNDKEDFVNVSAPLGSLDHLQAQSQEHMSAVSGIPLVKLLGITPSGLNASSDGEMRCFYDWIEASQEAEVTEPLSTVINLIQLSLFGEIDPNIGFKWLPLWTLDETALANVRKTDADTSIEFINAGVILPQEARVVLASQEDSLFAALDLDTELPPPPGQIPPGGPEDDPGFDPNGAGKPQLKPGEQAAPAAPGLPAPKPAPAATAAPAKPKTPFPPAAGGGSKAGGSNAPISKIGAHDDWNESEHPRGQPENAGEFASGSGGGSKENNGPATESPEFKSWFKGSKVTDESGKPLLVYHGGKPNQTRLTGIGGGNYIQGNIFFSDKENIGKFYTASRTDYMKSAKTMTEADGLYRAYLSFKKPLVVNAKGSDWSEIPNPVKVKFKDNKDYWGKTIQIDDLAEAAKQLGYDGLIVNNVFDQAGSGNQYVAFSPDQIKLVNNGESKSLENKQQSDMIKRVSKPDGGFTYQPVTHEEPETGYALSIHPDRSFMTDAKDLSVKVFQDYLLKNLDLLDDAKNFVGGWNDPETGKVFLDVSEVTQDEEKAKQMCFDHDQKAYFDLSKGHSVVVNPNAKSGGAIT